MYEQGQIKLYGENIFNSMEVDENEPKTMIWKKGRDLTEVSSKEGVSWFDLDLELLKCILTLSVIAEIEKNSNFSISFYPLN